MAEELTRGDEGASASPGRRAEALLVDVGFTLTTYDSERIARLAADQGVGVSAAALAASEGAIRAELSGHAWAQRPNGPAPAGGGRRFIRRLLELAQAEATGAVLDRAGEHVWASHLERNLWSVVLPGADEALRRLRAAGVRLAVVSNSEGTVEALLKEVGLLAPFEVVLDSWHVGLAKPDPRIFQLALDELGVAARSAIMVGDSLGADIEGARAAGVRGVLLDPHDIYPDATAPRFASLAAFVDSFVGPFVDNFVDSLADTPLTPIR